MALVRRKFKRFYKKGFSNRGKKPLLKKGGQSSSLFKARCFEYNSIDHLFEALTKKKKGNSLIGALDQDSSESEGEEKANLFCMALENEVQFSPSNLSNLVDDDDDLNSFLIEMYHELEKITKRKKELRIRLIAYQMKIQNLFVKTKLSLNLLKFWKRKTTSKN
ncbi:hypothetical protein M9H77_35447 [Catharanthus roseus]|uniref:Uncharacterized protein n=1 Tax=Catharanthus roseus TaxID=4058 RepID=A0ACB9ZTB2_CATRO|nr:hypothetical protein M9H77_35447 [Catharanthus roseus]